MNELYAFRSGPTYRGATPQEQYEAALSQPMSLASTFFDQAKGGVLESFGLGTAIRDITTPEGVKPEPTGDAYTDTITKIDEAISPRNLAKRIIGTFDTDQPPMSKDAYEASEYARDGVPWDASMTEDRAASLAMAYDAKRVREFYAEKRPITSFVANLAGQATDPINYIPIAGPAVRAAAVARTGRVAGLAATASLDAAANTAIFGLGTASQRRQFGDDVSWQATVSQIATAALIGGAFGTIAGALGSRADATSRMAIEERLSTLKTTQEARIALNEGIDALVRAEDVALSPNATQAVARVADSIAEPSVPVVDRPQFKEWFGKSRVVDDAGAPLVVYHGTSASFDAFDKSAVGQTDAGKLGVGFYFSAKPEIASFYAERAPVKNDVGPNVMPAYVSIQKPLEFNAAEGGDIWSKLRSQSKEWGIELDPVKDDAATPNDAWAYAFTDAAKENGYDGVILKFPDGGHEVVAFEPTQIKSRFNTGDFSRTDPRVIDASPPRPEPIPEGRAQAESRIAKPDDYKALAAQYRVDPETGSFAEEADITQLGIEGRLTEEDLAVLADSQNAFDDGAAYGEALRSVASCLV